MFTQLICFAYADTSVRERPFEPSHGRCATAAEIILDDPGNTVHNGELDARKRRTERRSERRDKRQKIGRIAR